MPNQPNSIEGVRLVSPLSILTVADSTFLFYVSTQRSLAAIHEFHNELRLSLHPSAAHVPFAASCPDGSDECNDDGEPALASIGTLLRAELIRYKRCLRRGVTLKSRGGVCTTETNSTRFVSTSSSSAAATAILVVRYFGERLLGVSCGRLQGLYRRGARLALHRHLYGKNVPFVETHVFQRKCRREERHSDSVKCKESDGPRNIYGLGAGDTELLLDVIPIESLLSDLGINDPCTDNSIIVQKLMAELHFEKMIGSRQEVLPRLQNLQGDNIQINIGKGPSHLTETFQTPNTAVIPIYRYPGNYSGIEWPTHAWSPTTLCVKRCVEEALMPLYQQHMNHCVTNLYRNGKDRIDHHSDKNLDLNREGVIVSVSFGSIRVMELRDRQFPHDVARVELPPGSMFVLGPKTNARFTHAILPLWEMEEEVQDREEHESWQKKWVNQYDHSEVKQQQEKQQKQQTHFNIQDGGRISLTFRDVRTFLDVRSQRLFGQGATTLSCETSLLVENGVITNYSMQKAVEQMRREEVRERNETMSIAAIVGLGVVSASASDRNKHTRVSGMSMLSSVAIMGITTSAFYCYLRCLKKETRRRCEERDARDFFSKMSASGNAY